MNTFDGDSLTRMINVTDFSLNYHATVREKAKQLADQFLEPEFKEENFADYIHQYFLMDISLTPTESLAVLKVSKNHDFYLDEHGPLPEPKEVERPRSLSYIVTLAEYAYGQDVAELTNALIKESKTK